MNDLTFGLPLHAVEKIQGVLASHPEVERAVLYGSRAKGNYKTGSDIDLTMYGDDLNHTLLLKILDELDDLLLPWMIDLSIFSQIGSDSLREHIERVGVVFYEREAGKADSRGDTEGAEKGGVQG
ncbi:MAG: nucleotidyltransferase domain-containing protein [Deltaproteobacteria bacterium]|nr:nucleotidyltransferase domain-containing protein [Deltaproteobacteria bacterium]